MLRECIADYNSTVIARNIVKPVSELLLKLPKLTLEMMVSGIISTNTTHQQPCGPTALDASEGGANRINHNRYHLICDNSVGQFTFYENDSFDLLNSSAVGPAGILGPVQCLLNIEYNDVINELSAIISANGTGFATTTFGSERAVLPRYEWSFLFVILFIFAGGLGNILVCLAVALDRKLQNVTNYFLLSLAIADLLVSLFVMPLGAIPGFLGEYIYLDISTFFTLFKCNR